MIQANWNRLSFFEQLSNIAGEVQRLIDNHVSFLKGESKDYSEFYLRKINELVQATFLDPKNNSRRKPEIQDEVDELSGYLKGNYSAAYIMSYWNQYTNAVASASV